VSEIARAFGQPGGGLQILVRDSTGAKVPVSVLLKAKVIA
jgi:hypothetical protein